jgi:hypothetical protein
MICVGGVTKCPTLDLTYNRSSETKESTTCTVDPLMKEEKLISSLTMSSVLRRRPTSSFFTHGTTGNTDDGCDVDDQMKTITSQWTADNYFISDEAIATNDDANGAYTNEDLISPVG